MSPPYFTVYQITQRAPNWPFCCIGLLFIIGGAVVIGGKRRWKWKRPGWFFAISLCFFGLLWSAVVGLSVLSADLTAFNAYRKGEYQTVEGTITDFRPMPYEGHKDECFSVREERFCYSDYEIAPGFHSSASHGGPIRAGLPVRVAYRKGRILRLEIPKDRIPSLAERAATVATKQRQQQQRTDNDPFTQEMNTAFLFTGVCWTFWWNLQWKQFLRFWLKPPHRRWAEILFRVSFALCFLGAANGFMRQSITHPIKKENVGPTALIAVVMWAAIAAISMSVLWMARRQDRKVSRTGSSE